MCPFPTLKTSAKHPSDLCPSEIDEEGQGSFTVKVGDVTVRDGVVTVGDGEVTVGVGFVTVGLGVVTVGVTLLTIAHVPMFPFASVLRRNTSPPAPKDHVPPATM